MNACLTIKAMIVALSFPLVLMGADNASIAKPNDDPILSDLCSSDMTRVTKAVEEIQDELAMPPEWSAGAAAWGPWAQRVRRLERQWVPALMRAAHPAEAADVALVGMAAMPSSTFLNPLGKLRVDALLAAGQPKQALAAARVYFDVCAMEQTGMALDLVARCLTATRPDDPDVARRLRLEQTDAATTRPYATAPLQPPQQAVAGQGIGLLAGIARDAEADKAYLNAVALHEAHGDEAYSAVRYANALLLAGEPLEARSAFEQAAERCAATDKGNYARPEILAEAIDGIARSIKAEDAAVGRANAYVLRLRDAAAAATP